MEVKSSAEKPVVLSDAIVDVSDQWVGNVPQMPSYLVKPTRFRCCFNERIAIFEGPKTPEMCFSIDSFAFRDSRNWGVDDTFVRGNTSYECDICLLHTALFERHRYRTSGIFVQREDKRTACWPIQTVRYPDIVSDQISNHSHCNLFVLRPAAMDQKSRGLVDDDDVRVLIENLKLSC